jgi:signal peptidase
MKMALRILRVSLDGALLLLVAGVVVLALAAALGPAMGHQPVVIRGGSMAPAIPLGALVDVVGVDPSELAVGDIVTMKTASGVLVTHRIVRIVSTEEGLSFELKGDANAEPDAGLVPATAVQGRVAVSVPILGYMLYMLTSPTGLASLICLALTLLFLIWLLEDLEQGWGLSRSSEPRERLIG